MSVSVRRQARKVKNDGLTADAFFKQPSPTPVREVSAAPPGRDGGVVPCLGLVPLWRIFEKDAGRSAQAYAANPGATLAVTTAHYCNRPPFTQTHRPRAFLERLLEA